jgi:hypothetical protein
MKKTRSSGKESESSKRKRNDVVALRNESVNNKRLSNQQANKDLGKRKMVPVNERTQDETQACNKVTQWRRRYVIR